MAVSMMVVCPVCTNKLKNVTSFSSGKATTRWKCNVCGFSQTHLDRSGLSYFDVIDRYGFVNTKERYTV